MHPGKPIGSAAAQQMQQERFSLIVPMMCGCNPPKLQLLCDFIQKGIPFRPRCRFQRNTPLFCCGRNIRRLFIKRDPFPLTEGAAKRGVPQRFLTANSVIQMRSSDGPELSFLAKTVHFQQQRHRIRAAGECDQNAIRCGNTVAVQNFFPQNQHEQTTPNTDVFMIPLFCVFCKH